MTTIDRRARIACATAAQQRLEHVANTTIDVSTVERIDDEIGVNAVFPAIYIAFWKTDFAHRADFSISRPLRSNQHDLRSNFSLLQNTSCFMAFFAIYTQHEFLSIVHKPSPHERISPDSLVSTFVHFIHFSLENMGLARVVREKFLHAHSRGKFGSCVRCYLALRLPQGVVQHPQQQESTP